jgi:hypothetical protein
VQKRWRRSPVKGLSFRMSSCLGIQRLQANIGFAFNRSAVTSQQALSIDIQSSQRVCLIHTEASLRSAHGLSDLLAYFVERDSFTVRILERTSVWRSYAGSYVYVVVLSG